MPNIAEIRKSVVESTPVLAVVGVTDLAVRRVREAAASAGSLTAEVENAVAALEPLPAAVQAKLQQVVDPKVISGNVQQLPALAVARALEAAGQVEANYAELAERGRHLVERIREQRATQELISSGRSTVSRTRAAVTTARRAVDDTASAAREVVTVGRREVRRAAPDTLASAAAGASATAAEAASATARTARTRTAGTRTAAKKATGTAKTGAARTRAAATGARTSARKTAATATSAAAKAAAKAAPATGTPAAE